MIPSNQRNQTPNQNKIKMIPQFQGVDLLLLEPSKLEFLPDSESKKWVKITVRITHTTHHNDEFSVLTQHRYC